MHRYLANTHFKPETIAKICEAFELAKRAMHDHGQPELIQEILARKIIDLAQHGENNPAKLSRRALHDIGLPHDTAAKDAEVRRDHSGGSKSVTRV
jgi:hypothetical protein